MAKKNAQGVAVKRTEVVDHLDREAIELLARQWPVEKTAELIEVLARTMREQRAEVSR